MDFNVINKFLPQDVKFVPVEGLYWKEKHIGSFYPSVICNIIAESDDSIQEFVRLYKLN